MAKYLLLTLLSVITGLTRSQDRMTPELLWSLNRVSPVGLSEDGQTVVFSVTRYNYNDNSRSTEHYQLSVMGGDPQKIESYANLIRDDKVSPDGKYALGIEEVKIKDIAGSDFYEDMTISDVKIFDNLNYRHWDQWEDGKYNHVFLYPLMNGTKGKGIDLMPTEPFDCPQQPFGGSEDYIWNPDGTQVLYVSKKKFGTEYAVSTNTDIYAYQINSKLTTNLTMENEGYDTQPAFSQDGQLAWLQMKLDGYESDKNDIIVRIGEDNINLTNNWDGTVNGFLWGRDSRTIYFTAATEGTVQMFRVNVPASKKGKTDVRQITSGQFDVNGLVGQAAELMVVSRTDMNHAAELYTVDLGNGKMTQLTHANDSIYDRIKLSRVDKRMVTTTDGKQMPTWVIYPPDFDPSKKYPTLLYCQGGPQSALSQFYSYRWNFQLMAAQGYIVVAPNRRGMPGYGVGWNEQISGDWGGQNMNDYLSAIDDVSNEPFVDSDRLGCVGASYGGYSAFYLAGIHDGRFKSFIAHDGIFNTRSMYGTTEELFFVNKDLGGPYWEKSDDTVQKSYNQFNPINLVDNWKTPILIIQGGRDYRVPIGQGLEAFQAAQLRGIKSKLLYFPEENHWILSAQNGIVWQREFFGWLEDTL